MSPTDLVELAAERGLKIIVITDHNTTDGLAEAQAAAENHADLEVIPRGGANHSCRRWLRLSSEISATVMI